MANDPNIGRKSLGVEVSASNLTAVLVDENGTIGQTARRKTSADISTVEQIAELLSEIDLGGHEMETLGIALPGLVHRDTKRVAYSSHFPEHSEIDLEAAVQDACGMRAVIENDANAAAFGELKLGAGRGSTDMFYATLGTGVGGAFIFEGKIWHGRAGFAGEFGYVAINSEGMRLEDVASAENIVRRTRARIRQDNTSSLSSLAMDSITLANILKAAGSEDDLAKMMLQRTGEYVGTAVASVINLLNVETVVLGGETMDAGQIVIDAVIGRAREHSFGPSFSSTKILVGTLGPNAAAAGAALISAGAA